MLAAAVAAACADASSGPASLDASVVRYARRVCAGGTPCQELGAAHPDGTPAPETDGFTWYERPTWTLDGSRVAFVRGGAVMVRDGTGARVLIPQAAGTTGETPSWSANGATIAYGRGSGIVCTMPAAGGGERCTGLAEYAQYYFLALAPDGRTVAARFDSAGRDDTGMPGSVPRGLVRIDVATGARTPVPVSGAGPWFESLALSPDGSLLAFAARAGDRGAVPRVYVVAAKGGLARRLTGLAGGTAEHSPVWSPDGRWVAVAIADSTRLGPASWSGGYGPASWDVHAVRAEGGEMRRVTTGAGAHPIGWHR